MSAAPIVSRPRGSYQFRLSFPGRQWGRIAGAALAVSVDIVRVRIAACLWVVAASPAAWAERPILHERVEFNRDETRVALPDEIAAPAGDDHVVRPDPFTHAPDARTRGDDHLVYNVVWDPSVAPFKRSGALDRVLPSGELAVASPDRRVPVPVVGGEVAPGREGFRGSMTVELRPGQPTALPTPAADLRILRARTSPDVPVRFSRDSADNLYVEALSGGRREVRLALVVDARSDYFGGPQAPPERGGASLPPVIRERADAVLDAIGGRALPGLIQWFRDFRPGELQQEWGDLYLDIALSKVGVCRHRSYAFLITALAASIPARFVYNEAHAFVEVRLRGQGWRRVDLGGAALSFDLRNPSESPPHRPRYADPYPKPEAYRANSTRDSLSRSGPAAGAGPGAGPGPGAAAGGAAPADPPAGASSDPAATGAADPAGDPRAHPPGSGGLPADPGRGLPFGAAEGVAELLDIPITLTPATTRRDKTVTLRGHAQMPFKPALLAEEGDLILHEWPVVRPVGGQFRGRIQIPADIPPGRYRILAVSAPGP